MNDAMPPRSRNHRLPAGCDAPTASAASSLVSPFATSRQNSRSTSRRSEGAPGDFIADLPVNAFIHPAGLPINTSIVKVLRRPVEFTQYTSIGFGQHLAQAGIQPSVGSVGDAYDNALAETTIGLYKTECIRTGNPTGSPFHLGLHTLTEVEHATASWVHWYNTTRLMHRLGRRPPAEAETAYYAGHTDHTVALK